MKDAWRELLLDQNFLWTSMRRWQGIEDSQCVHMHGHGQQRQHQPDLLQPFAQTQYAWIQPQCRKQYWSCTMGSAIAQWARVWHFYSLLTTQFAGTPIVGKKSLSYTTTLRELCILSTKIGMHWWNFINWLLMDDWFLLTVWWIRCKDNDVSRSTLNGVPEWWCIVGCLVWSLKTIFWMTGRALSHPACSRDYFSTHLLQTFLVFCQTMTNDTK